MSEVFSGILHVERPELLVCDSAAKNSAFTPRGCLSPVQILPPRCGCSPKCFSSYVALPERIFAAEERPRN